MDGFADSSVKAEDTVDDSVKFEIVSTLDTSISEAPFAIFETSTTAISDAIESFADTRVKVEAIDSGPVSILNKSFEAKMEIFEKSVLNSVTTSQYEAIPVSDIHSLGPHFQLMEGDPASDVHSVSPGEFEVVGNAVPITIDDTLAVEAGVHDSAPQLEVMGDNDLGSSGVVIVEDPGNAVEGDVFPDHSASQVVDVSAGNIGDLASSAIVSEQPTTSMTSDGQFEVVEHPGQRLNGNGTVKIITSTCNNCGEEGQLEVIEGADGQQIPAQQLGTISTNPGTDNQGEFGVIAGTAISKEQFEAMDNTTGNATEDEIATLSTPEGLINVVQSLGDVQSVGDGQFTLVTPDGLLSVVNPDAEGEEGDAEEPTVNVMTENGVQYAIVQTPDGLVKVALDAPEGIAAGVLVADENGQLILQNIAPADYDAGGSENVSMQLPVHYANPQEQEMLQANGLVLEETAPPTSESLGPLPVTSTYEGAILPENVVEGTSHQGLHVQDQPPIEPECFEIYTVEGTSGDNGVNQMDVMEAPDTGEVEVISYSGDNGKHSAGYSGADFISVVEPPSIKVVDEKACVLCGKKFPHKEDLTLHLRLHAKESIKTFDCKLCEAKFSKCWLLRKHKISKHPHSNFSKAFCMNCGELFESKDRLCTHLWKVHKMRNNVFPCNCLDSEFDTEFYLNRHAVSRYCSPDSFFCNFCNEHFDSKDALRRHIAETSNESVGDSYDINHELYVCQVCRRGFTNARALSRHMDTHKESTAREQPFFCRKCGDQFYSQAELSTHLRSHLKRKAATPPREPVSAETGDQVCNICGARFDVLSNLSDHLEAHISGMLDRKGNRISAEPLYQSALSSKQCPYCKKDCHTLKRFNNHYCVRPGTDGRYPCQYCTKIFTNLSSVYSHLAWHRREDHAMLNNWSDNDSDHQEQASSNESEDDSSVEEGAASSMFYGKHEYSCSDCGDTFSSNSKLKLHITEYHQSSGKRGKSFGCEFCDLSFRSSSELNIHLTAHESSFGMNSSTPSQSRNFSTRRRDKKKLYEKEQGVYKCKVCGKVFVKFLSLCGHLATHKQKNEDEAGGADSDSSSEGMVIDFDEALSNFAKQERTHHSSSVPVQRESCHQCNICGRIYSRLRSLASHQASHGQNAKLFACNKCGAKFSSQRSLHQHKSTCRYERQICSCVKCGMKFANFGQLKNHLPGCLSTGS